MTIDKKELAYAIEHMTRQQGIYKVLRDGLMKKGYWHRLPRGNPKLGYKNMKERKGE